MQGKALTAVSAALILASLTGCGGGGGSAASSSASTAATNSSSASAAGETASSEREFQQRIEELQRRRRSDESEPGQSGAKAEPSLAPTSGGHHDSGGGAAQFRGPGDNSIQESGSEASAPDREQAAAALHGYLDSRVAGRWAAACSFMSASMVVGLERMAALSPQRHGDPGCPKVIAALVAALPRRTVREGAEADVGSLRLNGNRGFLLYHGARSSDYAMPVVKEGKMWKVAALAGAPLAR